MVVAMSAFVLQGALISISEARVAVGIMSQPSVTFNGSAHLHDQLTGQVHEHGANSEGHVHDGSNADQNGCLKLCWSIFGASVVIPAPVALSRSFGLLGRVELPPAEVADGVEPGGLIRPPSTLSIA